MVTKLVQCGDKYFLPVAREVIEGMGIDSETPLDAHVEGRKLIVSPPQPGLRREELDRILAEINAEWGDVLRALAE